MGIPSRATPSFRSRRGIDRCDGPDVEQKQRSQFSAPLHRAQGRQYPATLAILSMRPNKGTCTSDEPRCDSIWDETRPMRRRHYGPRCRGDRRNGIHDESRLNIEIERGTI